MARRGPRSSLVVALSTIERTELEAIVRRTTAAAGLVQRARTVLSLAAGASLTETARVVGVDRRIVRKWGRRYARDRLRGLKDEPRPGRPPVFSPLGGCPPREAGLRATRPHRRARLAVGLC